MRVLVVERSHDDRSRSSTPSCRCRQIAVAGRSGRSSQCREGDLRRVARDRRHRRGAAWWQRPRPDRIRAPGAAAAADRRRRAPTPTRDEWCRHLAAGADRFVALDASSRSCATSSACSRGAYAAVARRAALLGRIAAGVTHDLNNYLAALAGDLSMLRRNPSDRRLVTQAIEIDRRDGAAHAHAARSTSAASRRRSARRLRAARPARCAS